MTADNQPLSVTDIDTQKAALRATAQAERARIASSADDEDALCAPLLALSNNWQGLVVAGYMPIRHELSPLAALEAAQQHGAQLALPAVTGKAAPLLFRSYNASTQLERGFANILQPGADAPEVTPDIILTPLLAFDRKGTRLGYGAGHYDRTIADLRIIKPDLLVVGIAHAAQLCLFPLPKGAYDEKLDLVITPQQVFDFRP